MNLTRTERRRLADSRHLPAHVRYALASLLEVEQEIAERIAGRPLEDQLADTPTPDDDLPHALWLERIAHRT